METSLTTFIEALEDWQLATFYKFRFDEFMPDSKEKISIELNKRNIRIKDIDYIISKYQIEPNPNSPNFCPRCKSNFFFIDKAKITFKGAQWDNDILICQICGYKRDEGHKSSWDWIWNKIKGD